MAPAFLLDGISMSDDKMTTKSKRRPGLLESIGLLAAVIPCCLATFAFFGVERIYDLFGIHRSEPQSTQVQIMVEPPLLNDIPVAAPTQTPRARAGDAGFDMAGVWVGQFNDAGFTEFSDYVLELSRNGSNISGTAIAISSGNPNCRSSHPIRGQVNFSTLTLVLTETLGGASTCPTFPRGSAGDIKTFTLAYDTADGIPALKGVWQKIYDNSWDAPGEIVFYRRE